MKEKEEMYFCENCDCYYKGSPVNNKCCDCDEIIPKSNRVNPPSNLGGEVTRTLTEQIIELIGEEHKDFSNNRMTQESIYQHQCFVKGFNQARTEMINKIPEILSLIRGIIKDEKEKYEPTYENADMSVVNFADDLLEKLK